MLDKHNLSGETQLYREAERASLTPTGLAFAESTAPNWQETMELRALQAKQAHPDQAPGDRVEVGVSIEELLRQGGTMYPVESVTVEKAWYFTLPSGSIEVREVH